MSNLEKYFVVNKNDIEFLFQQVSKYYPIGITHFNIQDYSGFILMNELVKSKFSDSITSQNSSINLLKNELLSTYGSDSINDLLYYEFPSFTFEVSLSNKDNEDYQLSTNLVLVISNLVDYYTVYFEDFYKFKNFKGGFDCSLKIQSFAKKIEFLNYKDYVDNIVRLMKTHFPEKKYIYNKSIQQKVIKGGTPYLIDFNYLQNHSGLFSIFDFLFSNSNVEFAGSIQNLH